MNYLAPRLTCISTNYFCVSPFCTGSWRYCFIPWLVYICFSYCYSRFVWTERHWKIRLFPSTREAIKSVKLSPVVRQRGFIFVHALFLRCCSLQSWRQAKAGVRVFEGRENLADDVLNWRIKGCGRLIEKKIKRVPFDRTFALHEKENLANDVLNWRKKGVG